MSAEKINAIYKVSDTSINGFFKGYRWLSNFHECDIKYEGVVYPSSEAAYQAAKTLVQWERQRFTKVKAYESKKLGRQVTLRDDWEKVKDQVMYDILMFKFTFHPTLNAALIATGDKHLEETNYWGDKYWGVCDGEGKNRLGETLMAIRAKIKTNDRGQQEESGVTCEEIS